jgi:hypothetical protein
MTIRKGTFTFAFMFDDNIDSEEFVRSLSVDQILGNCDTEHMLGHTVGELVIVDVPNEQVAAEEIAMGSDGAFFADPDELADARMDGERPDRPCDATCSRRFSPAAECDCSRSKL